MRRLFTVFLYYTRNQQIGTLILAVLLLTTLLVAQGHLPSKYPSSPASTTVSGDSTPTEILRFLSEAQKMPPRKRPLEAFHPKKISDNYPQSIAAAALFPFRPNQADSLTLRRLGLPAWMVHRLLQYRARGGRFRRPADLQKLYGLRADDYQRLLPYIIIDAQDTIRPSHPSLWIADRDTATRRPRPAKLLPGTRIELNQADTTQLQQIPGIGSALARRIVRYRQQLGGFYDLQQLREIHLDSRQLQPWLTLDTTRIERIAINLASLSRLQRHPYLNFYQARTLLEYRRRQGPIRHLKTFRLLEEFTPADLDRLSHYIDYRTEP